MGGPWIAVASADHVAAGVQAGVFACSHGRGDAAARPRNRDRFAYYAPRERMGGGAPVQAFVALGHILDDAPAPHDLGGFHCSVRRAAYDAVATAPVRPLLGRLGFVRDPQHWGMAFRRGLFAVSPEDFAVIEAALLAARDG
jgi:EVE domain